MNGPDESAIDRAAGLPPTMRAVAIERFGGPDRLELVELPVPIPARGEVLIRVHGAGVGVWDVAARRGEWDLGRPFPLVLGLEAAGVVARTGSEDSAFREGDRVMTYCYPLPYQGAYAEYMVVPERYLAPAPTSVDLLHAAALPVAGITAHLALTDVLDVRSGDVVLVTAAAGGVGTLAAQLARELGARVVATASPASVEYLRELGVEEIVDYEAEDWAEQVRAMHPDGVDAVLEGAGGETARRSVVTLRDGGRLADLTGAELSPEQDIQVLPVDAEADAARLTEIGRLVDAGRLQVRLSEILPLRQAARAQEKVEERHVHGKLVLRATPHAREGDEVV